MALSLQTLLDLPLNVNAVVARIRSTGEYQQRLTELGIRVGGQVRVIQRDANQPLMLAAGDSRVAINWEMGKQVWVSPQQ
ncbi:MULTISPECIES: FeoA family protein [Dickeya]|jgi:ferrous iron transport protein A|uniref:Ferrous iron transport protein A n=3 Tax=Dickeya TaxID=204037 RepID=A0A2K9QFG0_9GAMM|nr:MULTISPECIES: FeoA family protein [Dickeya]AJC66504.1 fatty-acid synthase [Dickeya zeae EC1]PXW48291.1 ferrous iron transport protein A [Erwinia sp. AG740]AIR67780.1 fatty-acid synthase [Dickeya fangzhongdai]AUQ25662.1 ferrous iron transport protein A [Dickeya zeae]AYH48336.1 fatty-acid synthase [Dickeya fangzhongdai]